MNAVDLFAGPGGWDEGVRDLGIHPVGIEWDAAACATRHARGHATVQADVSQLDPLEFGPCELLIGSPPCQAFSAAGKGDGNKDVRLIMEAANALGRGEDIRAGLAARLADERSLLVVEPLRWALALKPAFIACEQVPPVLQLWQAFAEILRFHGYSVWAGVLSAERYGVPQTRERAFLMASRGTVYPPAPTHQEYVYGEPAAEQHTIEGHLAPWLSMAEALGWGMTERPVTTVTAGGSRQGGADPLDGGSGARATLKRERERGAWVVQTQNFTAKNHRGHRGVKYERPIDDPPPTLDTKVNRWTLHTNRDQREDGSRQTRDAEAPAPSLTGKSGGQWYVERPATTIAGDSRVFQPGGHHEPGKQSQNAVRVTIQEASILQGFPPDYPWQGSRTKQFEQVGNAVPPPLARAVITALLGDALEVAA